MKKKILTVITAAVLAVSASSFRSYADVTVNDHTQLNPIKVAQVVQPESIEEIVEAVSSTTGKISIGGGRYSMGGQIASTDSLHLDMRQMDKIIEVRPEEKTITVQGGATWRKVQQAIDPYNLSVKVMQSYSNFTVGGALSVNAHGRYIGFGPIISTVKSIKLILADGSIVTANRTENRDLFNAAIGGYGGIGVIAEATLELAENKPLKRITSIVPLKGYKKYREQLIAEHPKIVLNNAEIFENDVNHLRVKSWEETDEPVTVEQRLQPSIPEAGASWRIDLLASSLWAKWVRRNVVEPAYFSQDMVVWRNYEAGYEVNELGALNRDGNVYALQEYFVPADKVETFARKMDKILKEEQSEIVNISIRHATADNESILSWAPKEMFAFVLFYRHGQNAAAIAQARKWNSRLIDTSLALGGTYYLPYRLDATQKQFRKAYPRWNEFAKIKQQVDPQGRFSNKLIEAYLN